MLSKATQAASAGDLVYLNQRTWMRHCECPSSTKSQTRHLKGLVSIVKINLKKV